MPRSHKISPFKPLDVALALFLAGVVPTVLMGLVSYTMLRGTLESRIVQDRHTLVLTLVRLITAETSRPGEMIDYYRTVPEVKAYTQRPPGDAQAMAWMTDAYSSHSRLDGMFLTDAHGRLIISYPEARPEDLGKDYGSAHWIAEASQAKDYYVSPVYPRIPDMQLCSSNVTAIRGADGKIEGYLGANISVDRVGRRLAALNFGDNTVVQVIDQTGRPLFDSSLQPNMTARTEDPALLQILDTTTQEHFRWGKDLVSFQKIDGAKWIALLRQPMSVAYQTIWDWAGKEAVFGAWLLALYGLAAWMASWFYQNHLETADRIARETSFSQTILAHMPIGIALLDSDSGRVLEANGKFVEMAREFGGAANGADAENMHLRDLPNLGIDAAVKAVTVSGRPFQTREQTVQDSARRTRFLSVNLLRLQDAAKRTHGVLLLMEDATHDVETRRDLIAANTAKDQFLALLSHELRNPLSPVITMVSELDRMTDSPEARNALEIIRRNVELEARLIDDLLDITRIAHGKLQLTPETINAHRAIHRALEICQRDIDAKGLEVRLDLVASSFHVRADPARFQQVLWNLIKNAVKFTPGGSITISSINSGTGRLIIEVADTGIGITKERLTRLFKPFEQGESSITRRYGGLGLGLAISKAMIEAHGGVLKARSAGLDHGSTFTVELGTVEAPVELPEPVRVPVIEGPAARHKILLVDDHEDTCTGMRMILERRGYRVRTADSVQGALDVAEEYPFELLISDLGLPDGTGFDLMKELKRRRGEGIRGVALSGFGMESDIERSMEAGFEEHLIKPVNLERLGEILHQVFPPAEVATAGKA